MADQKLSAITDELTNFTLNNLRLYVADLSGTPASKFLLLDKLQKGTVYVLALALAQKDTDIEQKINVASTPIPEDMTFAGAFVGLNVAPVGQDAIYDINLDGVSALSTKITIAAGQFNSIGAGDPVFSTTTATKGQRLTIDCDQKGLTTAGQDPVICIFYKKNTLS